MNEDTIIRIEDADGEPGGEYHECRWIDFRSDNRDDDDTLAQVACLRPGEHVIIGGGAAPAFRVLRPA